MNRGKDREDKAEEITLVHVHDPPAQLIGHERRLQLLVRQRTVLPQCSTHSLLWCLQVWMIDVREGKKKRKREEERKRKRGSRKREKKRKRRIILPQ